MNVDQQPGLYLPSFLYGTLPAVEEKTRTAGRQCAVPYRKDGSVAIPHELIKVPSSEIVLAHEVTDFQRERPAWRLYMVSNVITGLCDALDWQDSFHVGDVCEESCLTTAWGGLYFAISQAAPMSAQRVALRLQAVLRFWEPLQSARYLFKRLNAVLTLEELMVASCDWAMEVWCPESAAPTRTRLAVAAARMARATREDSIEAILRLVPRVLTRERDLKHRDALMNQALLRQRLMALEPAAFEGMSAACTSDLLGHLYDWDRELGLH